MAQVRDAKREATQRLLGATMAITDEHWQSPSRLPGWTRAHVATHLARGADALSRVCSALVDHRPPVPMYDSQQERTTAIERGSERPGIELQIDLDTSAGRLHEWFDDLEKVDPATPVILLPDVVVHAHDLPAVRLAEVLLHHVDLDVGFDLASIDDLSARVLVEWVCFRLRRRRDIPALHVVTDSGLTDRIGGTGFATTVSGPDAVLAGWLSGRTCAGEAQGLRGVDGLALPLMS
ncbi:maleylpyruvate isomerase family mycothiol-dependent enzyme [Acidipropionibacterium timonense]|uniref:maleylpyruvate isomerase family mycothiol-dependent enzyme n=1 Tax=Acidipropionibacterium timonense TaxID=2161818 RepID=UPI0024780AD5|nr:maleylpyruvate isomerase family mycothiol-dependent enzyme [Acidipropionibacterium timonense]